MKSEVSEEYCKAVYLYGIAINSKIFSNLQKCIEMKKALDSLIKSNEYCTKDPNAIKLYDTISDYLSKNCICD